MAVPEFTLVDHAISTVVSVTFSTTGPCVICTARLEVSTGMTGSCCTEGAGCEDCIDAWAEWPSIWGSGPLQRAMPSAIAVAMIFIGVSPFSARLDDCLPKRAVLECVAARFSGWLPCRATICLLPFLGRSAHDVRHDQQREADHGQDDQDQGPCPRQKVGALVLWFRRSDPQHGMKHSQELKKETHYAHPRRKRIAVLF